MAQDGDLQAEQHVAPQRGRHPEPVEVEGARVEADHQVHLAELLGELVEVGIEVRAAALLRGLDEDEASRMGRARRFERLEREQGAEDRVAVISCAAAEEQLVAPHRLVGAEALAPVAQRRLLVEMAVDERVA